MPLFKRTPFFLLEPPKNLDPNEKVFQVRFTKEIFRDYQEYLNRLNFYRQRVWTCKVSGKTNLTYEEALVWEQRAAEKAQQLPKELIVPVLRMIQYSTLNLTDLVNKVYSNLLLGLYEGLELYAKKDGFEAACKILKVIGSGNTKLYEVGWIGQDNAVINTSVVKADDLIRKKAPASRNTLKFFIRDSTSQNCPWILHVDLAKTYGIPTESPEDMMNGDGLYKGRKRLENGTTEDAKKKLKKDETQVELPVKYPIDDLLVKPSADDPVFSKRPPLSTDFRVPIDSVGDLLMVWDFCLSFGRLLCLSPFSLSDLENAICNKESNLILLVEIHAAFFHLLIKDQSEYFTFVQNKKRTRKVTLVTWADYLGDFLEMMSKEELSCKVSTVRRGHYGLIDPGLKLKILRELVDESITTSALREKLDEQIGQQQALAAAKREDARKYRKEQKLNMEGVAENGINHTDAAHNGNESVKDQREGKEQKDLNNFSSSKMGDGKMYLRRHQETETEQQSLQPNPLGKDRFYNRYWFFMREGRFFVESADSKEWGYYSTKEELDALRGSLNIKGTRERALKWQLDKSYDKISNALEKRLKDVEHRLLLEEAVLRRSTRVHAQPKEDNPSRSFLKYVNKWKQK
uniref:DDT domain-containing protein n=1 Tax=Arundo donax TaxID=35708 RepID=A0A0A9D0T1_ARUDO